MADQKNLGQGLWNGSNGFDNNVHIIKSTGTWDMSEANQVCFKREASRKREFTKIMDRELFQYAADTICVGASEKMIEIHSLNLIRGSRNPAIDSTVDSRSENFISRKKR